MGDVAKGTDVVDVAAEDIKDGPLTLGRGRIGIEGLVSLLIPGVLKNTGLVGLQWDDDRG
jgi:repressor of nif and glnA expression